MQNLPDYNVVRTTECEVCKEPLNIVRVKAWRTGERTIAVECESGKQHVCFTIPQDANLIVLD